MLITHITTRNLNSNGAAMMRAFLMPKPSKTIPAAVPTSSNHVQGTLQKTFEPSERSSEPSGNTAVQLHVASDIFTGYFSDMSDMEDEMPKVEDKEEADPENDNNNENSIGLVVNCVNAHQAAIVTSLKQKEPSFHVQPPPTLKQQHHAIPIRKAGENRQKTCNEMLQKGLTDITKLIQSKQQVFDAGKAGLQSYRA
jgi:hypothetical protein